MKEEVRGTLGLPCLSEVCQVTGYQDDVYMLTLIAITVIPVALTVGFVIWDKVAKWRSRKA